jgi:hypothetical protein
LSGSYSVRIIDMAHYMDESEEYTVGGFPDFEAAKAYARNHVRRSVEELCAANQPGTDLRLLWHVYGEDALVVGGEESYAGSHDLYEFIERPEATEGQS